MGYSWHPVRVAKARELAGCHGLSSDFRLALLAFANIGPGGHANFERNGLRRLLTKVTRETGELGEYTDRRIASIIASCVKAGVLAPTSNSRCLVVPMDFVDTRNRPKSKPCPVHGHWMAWQRGGWVSVNPDNHAVVAP